LLGVLLLGLGAFLAWQGVSQKMQGDRIGNVGNLRNGVISTLRPVLKKTVEEAEKAAKDPAVESAVALGDREAAKHAFQTAWPGVERAEVLSPDLEVLYADLSASGYGRTALAESVINTKKSQLAFVKSGSATVLAVGVPLKNGDVGLGQVSAAPVMSLVTGAATDGSYVALMQGRSTIASAGDSSIADKAGGQSKDIEGTRLSVLAVTGEVPPGVFGLTVWPSLILGLLGVLGGLWLLLEQAKRRKAAAEARAASTPDEMAGAVIADDGSAVTVSDLVDQHLQANQAARQAREQSLREIAAVRAASGVDKSIFRAYDIRGVVGDTLSKDVAQKIGQAIGSLMHEKGLKDIVVGRDGRLSGLNMVEGLTEGLRAAGRNVIDIGMAPTPVVYYGAYELRTGTCVAVTGSHNPPDYNGFKIVVGGTTLSGDAITDLYTRISEGRLHQSGQQGTVESRDIAPAYIERIASDIQLERPLRVVVDAGNGVAGEVGPAVLEAIGATVERLYCEIDGHFPNHHPDPSEPHNLEDLIDMVARRDADIGLAFDGDGDRLGVVTRAGHNIFPDRLLMLFADDVLTRNPGAVIVHDVKCTGAIGSFVMGRGGSPMMWKTGHSLIKAKMKEEEAELAGEMSGHFFFQERWYGFDDGIYAAARLLEILARRTETADEVFAEIPEGIATPEIKVPVDDPHAFVARFSQFNDFDGAKLTKLDGLRADWSDGWGLVRASNTTPILVLRFEANTEARLEEIKEMFRGKLREIDPDLQLTF
jgi:phosphomannomutase/phosphoglucomutase